MKEAATIPQFCDGHNISRTHLYELIKQGKGPRLMKVGRRTLISVEAAADWRKRIEAETAAQAQSFWEKEAA
jgi:predicted DNA-binding transcriptional regulator AlpA